MLPALVIHPQWTSVSSWNICSLPVQGLYTWLPLLPFTYLPISSLTHGYFLREHSPASSPLHLKARVQVAMPHFCGSLDNDPIRAL